MADAHGETERHSDVRIHIDQKPYRSPDRTTGEALYKLGGVPGHHELYREVTGNQEDVAIPDSGETVILAEDEHLHTGPREFTIIVNGRRKEVVGRKLSFDEVVALAFDPVPTGPNIMFTITYRNGPRQNPEGTLLEGGKVKIHNGMIFDVTPTDKS